MTTVLRILLIILLSVSITLRVIKIIKKEGKNDNKRSI